MTHRFAAGAVVALVLALVLAFSLPSVAAAGAASSGVAIAGPGATSTAATVPSHAAGPVAPQLSSSGRGSFFQNSLLPTAPSADEACAYESGYPICMNNTGDPAIVATSSGLLATAYTAFTNISACPGDLNLTETEIGFSASSNGGVSWSAPSYLDNPGCADQFNYTSAIFPALAALSNGTLVLAYIEYNFTSASGCYYYYYYPSLAPCFVPFDRLVVTESYNDGVNWTAPAVVNSTSNTYLNYTSFMAEQPALAAYGNTVYLAWTNWTNPDPDEIYAPGPSIGLNMVVSTDGGASWGSPLELPVEPGLLADGTNSSVATAPALAVNATGTLFVTYATNFTAQTGLFCQTTGCGYLYNDEASMSVVLASSDDNGSSFSVSTVNPAVPVDWNGGGSWIYGAGALVSPEPELAIDPVTNDIYVAYTGGAIGTLCYSVIYCYQDEYFENLWISTSTNGGANWSAPAEPLDTTLGLFGAATDDEYVYTPSIAADAGNVYVDVAFTNWSACISTGCPLITDLFLESSNGGANYSVYSPWAGANYFNYPLWDGVQTSMTLLNGTPYAAWTWEVCPGNLAYSCGAPSSYSYSQVIVSSPFTGTGVTVSFAERGLPSGTNWTVDFSGNERGGAAGTTLSVSGVPPGSTEIWNVPWVNTSTYGETFASNVSIASPGVFSGNTTIVVNFTEDVELNVFTVPPGSINYPFYCGAAAFFGFYCGNAVVTPTPGTSWWPINTSISYGTYDTALPTNCYFCYNYTFLSWSGSGVGSWNTTTANGTAVLGGPVNETASFSLANVCYYTYGCFNITYPYTFHESGLPANVPWTMTVGNSTVSTTNATLTVQGSFGPENFTVWTVPFNATWSWVGTPSVPSPIAAPQANVTVTFRLAPDSSLSFPVTFSATGLPPSASGWGLDLGTREFGIAPTGTTLLLAGGSPGPTLNASSVYGNAGVGSYLESFSVTPSAENESPYTVAPGGSLALSGPATVVANFGALYWLDVAAPANGTVSPGSQWVHAGGSITLTATPDAGYSFVGWTGVGPGSRTATTASITVTVDGPVTEVATFSVIVPVAAITVTATGLPVGAEVTVYLGSAGYTAAPPFVIPGLLLGNYPVSAGTVAPNGTIGVEYAVTGIASSLPLASGQLSVTGNGSLTISYSTEYALTVNPSANGSVNLAPGTYWESTEVALTATPMTGYVFVAWSGTGAGSSNATTATIDLTLAGPVSETAIFAPYVAPLPRTYTLTVTPIGLPDGTSWSASIGGLAPSGVGALTFAGLNGTYTLEVPIVSPSAGVEYVPEDNGAIPEVVTATGSAQVTFTLMYEVSVSASTGGSATPSTGWVTNGSAVTLTATPNAGDVFVGWQGTGTGAYTGALTSTTITVAGPVNEVAVFAPKAAATSTASSPSEAIPLAALVALLVVGLVIGLIVGRARKPRSPRPSPPAEWTEGAAAGGGAAATTAPAATPEWSEEGTGSGAPADDGEEHIYGGGSG